MTENQSETQGAGRRAAAFTIRELPALRRADADGTRHDLPAPRGGATLTQVDSGDVYLIGGANREAQSFGDVVRFDLATNEWSVVSPTGDEFPSRSGHSAVAIGDRIVVFGGMNAAECVLYEDVFVLDTHTQRWTKPLVEGWMPGARNAHAAIALPAHDGHDRMLVYGGSSPEQGAFDDVYVLHLPVDDRDAPLRWERCECTTGSGESPPEARELHGAAFLTPTTVLFSGGRNRDGNVCTDMAALNIATWRWQLIPICEWNRCSHVVAAVDSVVVSFGGFDGSAIRDDCWAYADDEETWLRVRVDRDTTSKPKATHDDTGPETTETDAAIAERFGHCGCAVTLPAVMPSVDSTKRRYGMLVFGGMNAERDLNDLVLITPVVE